MKVIEGTLSIENQAKSFTDMHELHTKDVRLSKKERHSCAPATYRGELSFEFPGKQRARKNFNSASVIPVVCKKESPIIRRSLSRFRCKRKGD